MKKITSYILFLLAFGSNGLVTSKETSLIPRELIVGRAPTFSQVTISPDGKNAAYLAPENEILNIWIKSLDGTDARCITHDNNRGITVYKWCYDNSTIVYFQDIDGDENWQLRAVDIITGTEQVVVSEAGTQVQFLALNKNFPDKILVTMNKDNPQYQDVYEVDIKSGQQTMREKNFGKQGIWIVDEQFNVRGFKGSNDEDGSVFLTIKTKTGVWKNIITWKLEDAIVDICVPHPIKFSADGKHIYLTDYARYNTAQLVRCDCDTGEMKVIASDYTHDIIDFWYINEQVQVFFVEREKRESHILNASLKKDFNFLKNYSDGVFSIDSHTDDETQWIVKYEYDNKPEVYYLYNRNTQTMSLLGENLPEIKQYNRASVHPISFKARDGLTIHGYLTMPSSNEQTRIPLVVDIHGGPWSRNVWGFDRQDQFLANRGYAVLHINYRSSTGYGKSFLNAGNKEWGGKMHNDIIDGVYWAVKQDFFDPARIAVIGGSYGGYEALMCAVHNPDLFCCAFVICAPSNLVTVLKTIPPYWGAALWYKRVGDPYTDEAFLQERSPLNYIDTLKLPLFIIHGKNDPRVNIAEAEQIVATLKKNQIPHEYLLLHDEGHGIVKKENRLKYWVALEQFLSQHLGGDCEN